MEASLSASSALPDAIRRTGGVHTHRASVTAVSVAKREFSPGQSVSQCEETLRTISF